MSKDRQEHQFINRMTPAVRCCKQNDIANLQLFMIALPLIHRGGSRNLSWGGQVGSGVPRNLPPLENVPPPPPPPPGRVGGGKFPRFPRKFSPPPLGKYFLGKFAPPGGNKIPRHQATLPPPPPPNPRGVVFLGICTPGGQFS